MKIRSPYQLRQHTSQRRAFTLIEMTVSLLLAVMISVTGTAMMNQQVHFYRWMDSQRFVLEEAPITNSLVVRILSQADAFRIHADRDNALADTNGLTADGKVLVIGFAQPDGSRKYGLLEFTIEAGDSTGTLDYRNLDVDADTGDLIVTSSWKVTGGAADVTFSVQNGVLLMEMTDPYGGQITYAASSSL